MEEPTAQSAVSMLDHAARQTDRWLFLAALVVMGLALWWLARWIVKRHAEMLADQKQVREAFVEISKANAVLTAQATETIKESTHVLNEVRILLANARAK